MTKEKDYNVSGKVSAFDISPDGKKMAFVSRGELFVSDVEGEIDPANTTWSAERVSEVKWMDDNKTILFNQTFEGFQNLFMIKADGNGVIKQLTSDKGDNRFLSLNNKKSMGVYLSGRNEVRLIDLKTFKSRVIVKDELWGLQNSGPSFSPDGEYVIFTAYRNFEQDIFVHRISENRTINLTNTGITETSPFWGPDGKYIYFISSRLHPVYPEGLKEPKVYRLPLQKFDEPYRSEKFNELFKEENKDSAKKKDSTAVAISIDADKIMDRIEQIGPVFGSQYLLSIVQMENRTMVLYMSNHEGKMALYKTVLEPFEKPKTEKINGAEGNGADFVEANHKYFVLLNGVLNKLNLDGNKMDPISVNYTFRRNLSAEFQQMFYEAWAQLDENYYDEKFHGIDWNHAREYYSQFLPYVNNGAICACC